MNGNNPAAAKPGPPIVGTVFVLVLFLVANVYKSYQGSLESKVAVRQVEDDSSTYGFAHWVATANIPDYAFAIGAVLLIAMWGRWLYLCLKQS